jgi:Ca2+-binding EF-hand superfamily protein
MHDLDRSQGLDEHEFTSLLEAFLKAAPPYLHEAMSDSEMQCLMCLADQDKDGYVDLDELYFGLGAWYGYRCLQQDALRMFAECRLDCSSGSVDLEQLQVFLFELNGQIPVDSKEVETVIADARFLGGGQIDRRDVLRAIGIWYSHVARKPTPWTALVRLAVRRLFPHKEHHVAVLAHMERTGPALYQDLLAIRRGRSERAQCGPSAGKMPLVGGLGRVVRLLIAVIVHLTYLVTLVFPSAFFSLMLYVGCEHGNDSCPKDLDGLLIWYGALGLATLVVKCSGPFPVLSWILQTVLLVMPWEGAWWTLHLSHAERRTCGIVVSQVSTYVWNAVSFFELYVATLLLYQVHVCFRQERALVKRIEVARNEAEEAGLLATAAP